VSTVSILQPDNAITGNIALPSAVRPTTVTPGTVSTSMTVVRPTTAFCASSLSSDRGGTGTVASGTVPKNEEKGNSKQKDSMAKKVTFAGSLDGAIDPRRRRSRRSSNDD